MGPLAVSAVLVIALFLTVTVPGPTMGQVGAPADVSTNITQEDHQCSPLQRRQDLLDNRMNQKDARLNGLDARLGSQQNEINTRFNRIDDRFERLETAMSDMKEYVQKQMETMGQKVELALTGVNSDEQKCKSCNLLQPRATPGDFRPPKVPQVHQGCQEALTDGWTSSGVYSISLGHNKVIDVYCDQHVDGGGWTVFQTRKDGSVDFYQKWDKYSEGFGDVSGEFWLGNRNIHLLTKHHDQQLKIELTSQEGVVKYADYANFSIEDEAHKYKLHVNGFSGSSPPGDSMAYHNGMNFSTYDQDNDPYKDHCASTYTGAWWYNSCQHSNLNGDYLGEGFMGMRWYTWYHAPTMRATRMMMRRLP